MNRKWGIVWCTKRKRLEFNNLRNRIRKKKNNLTPQETTKASIVNIKSLQEEKKRRRKSRMNNRQNRSTHINSRMPNKQTTSLLPPHPNIFIVTTQHLNPQWTIPSIPLTRTHLLPCGSLTLPLFLNPLPEFAKKANFRSLNHNPTISLSSQSTHRSHIYTHLPDCTPPPQ